MSLLQVALAPSLTWAKIAVDTALGIDPSVKQPSSNSLIEGEREVSKIYALPHINAVVAVRGVHSIGGALAASLNHGLSLEEMLDNMPHIIEATRHNVAQFCKAGGIETASLEQKPNVALIAWRPEGAIARVWNGFLDAQHAIHHVLAGKSYASPYEWDDPIDCVTPAGMERVARRQVDYARSLNIPGIVIGGSLLVASVSRRGISIERLCDLDKPARPQMLFSAGVPV